ncbi:MAG: hypothetical protein ABIP51_23700 [Bacteroidia bacterium]
MNNEIISTENILQNIIDFSICKKMVDTAKDNNESMVILCPHYSINIASKFEDGEQLQWDMDELGEYIGEMVEVSDYDDMVVYLTNIED